MIRYCRMQSFDRLINQFNRCLHSLRAKHFYYLFIYFIYSKWFVYITNTVTHLALRLKNFFLTFVVCIFKQLTHAMILQQLNSCPEYTKFLKIRHVYSVIIRITDLRRTAYNNYFLRMQAVKNLQDTFFQCCSTHNTVVYYNKIVHIRNQRSVGYIIYVRGKIITRCTLCYKCTEFYILDCNFLTTHILMQNLFEFFIRRLMIQVTYSFYLLVVYITLETSKHSIECDFSSIGYKRENSMLGIVIDSL